MQRISHSKIDKSMFIAHIIDDPAKVKLILRTKAFGKSSNLTMLGYFLSAMRQKEHKELFNNMAIDQHAVYQQHKGNYIVIHLSLCSMLGWVFEVCLQQYRHEIASEFTNLFYGQSTDSISHYDSAANEVIIEQLSNYNKDLTGEAAENLLALLVEYCHACFNKEIIILVDEYDTPLMNSIIHGYFEKLSKFIDKVFTNAYNTGLVKFVVLAGSQQFHLKQLMKIDAQTYSMRDDDRYYADFGFTESDLEKFNVTSEQLEQIKLYYGYRIGSNIIFNPHTIINLFGHKKGDQFNFKNYWSYLSSDYIGKCIDIYKVSHKLNLCDDFVQLCQGNSVFKSINPLDTFDQIECSEGALWNMLVLSGYLSVKSKLNHLYELIIPNNEIKHYFTENLEQWFPNQFLINVPQSQHPSFTGREKELQQITDFFKSSHQLQTDKSHVVVCAGAPFIGKTHLALRYCQDNYEKIYKRILWINAENLSSLMSDYYHAALSLMLIEETASPEEIISKLKNWLENISSPWLIVYDGVTDYEMLEPFIPKKGGDVLITTRSNIFSEYTVKLNNFTLQESLEYINKFLRDSRLDRPEDLAARLDGLPQVLTKACYYIRRSKITIQAFLEIYPQFIANIDQINDLFRVTHSNHDRKFFHSTELSFFSKKKSNPDTKLLTNEDKGYAI